MRANGRKEGDPLHRILTATAAALRARQNLPRRDQRRVGSMWVRPNWPNAFLLSTHRNRLVEALAQDDALRSEVRDKLRLPDALEVGKLQARPHEEAGPSSVPVSELLADVMAAASDPIAVLEGAALDPDTAVAAAATPYLRGQLQIPTATPCAPELTPEPPADRSDPQARRQLREARAHIKSLQQDLREEQKQTRRLSGELSAAVDRASRAEAAVSGLRDQLPSRREREALASASTQQDKIAELQHRLNTERTARRTESRQLRERLSEAELALVRAQEKADAETRGRHRLEADLGDAAGRARRLEPLTEREAIALRQEASAMHDGPDKTRKVRRADSLEQLGAKLRELYDIGQSDHAGSLSSMDTNGDANRPSSAVHVRPRGLTVTPLGGANHIGGSALLVQAGATRLLVDAGLKPQAHISRPGPDRIDEAIREPIDAIVVTHAHADHAGFVPWVVERCRRVEVLCSPETKALLPTVWADSVHVMRAAADAASGWNDHSEPPYGDAEVAQAEDALRDIRYGQSVNVGDLEITLFRAGHIVGAAGVVVRAGERRVVITGDIDDRGQASVGAAQIPQRLAARADLLAIETTYCDGVHRDRGQEGNDLVRQAEDVLAAGGRVLIPAFGLGRAQEIALLLGERLPDVDVLVDGLARDISDLYARNGAPEVIRGRVRKVVHREREIIGFHEGVIITTSGMLTGGAAIPWAQAVLLEPDSALFLCGHQDEESPGHELQELADADPERPRRVRLRDEHGKPVDIEVESAVHTYNLSAHADRNGLKGIIDQIRPMAVMLVHGEPGPQALFRARLNAAGYTVVDNRETWNADAILLDGRLIRHRHGGGMRRRSH